MVEKKLKGRKTNGILIGVLSASCVLALVISRNAQSMQKEQDITITALNDGQVEYAKEEIKTLDLICIEPANREVNVIANPEVLDCSTCGEQKVVYRYAESSSTDKKEKEMILTFHISDNYFPGINLRAKTLSLKTGETFDPKNVIESVSDPVEGNLKLVEQAPSGSKDGWYTITSNVDTSQAGSYQITIHAEDNHGNVTEKIVNVAVSEDGKTQAEADESTEEATTSTSMTNNSTSGSSVKAIGTVSSTSANSRSGSEGSDSSSYSSLCSGSATSSSSSGTSISASDSSGTESSSTPVVTHTHNWQPVYTTVHHDEVTHEESEQIWVVDQAAYDEPVYEYYSETICNTCGYSSTAPGDAQVNDVIDHLFNEHDGIGRYHTEQKKIQTDTIHHDEVGHYETNSWEVVDQYAYDEQIFDHYECSCGATK